MRALSVMLLLAFCITDVFGFKNTSQEFNLYTVLKPGQTGKGRFDKLWLSTYHTGAGFSDAVLEKERAKDVRAFLNGTKGGGHSDIKYSNVLFNLGNDFPWFLNMQLNTEFYTIWQPVGIDVGFEKPSGFYINGTGLQWTNDVYRPPNYPYKEFFGWIVCDWWHEAMQLFFRNEEPGYTPCSCADVYLYPEYL